MASDPALVDLTAEVVAPAAAPKRRTSRRKHIISVDTEASSSNAVVVPDDSAQLPAEFRKAVEAITVRNVSTGGGEITLLQRKSYNAMLHVAQRTRKGNEVTFEITAAELESLVGHGGSSNREYLKAIARGLTDIKLEFDFKGTGPNRKKSGWGVANMVAEVYLSPDGSRIRFSFPPELANKLLDPEIYNKIDLRMQNLFTSGSALALYEIVTRYYGFQRNETFREPWETWSMQLSGATEPHREFRDFNKMLTRAIDQVNTHETRFQIEPHFSKRGRKMDKLWFVLVPQEQPQLPLNGTPTLVGDEVLKRLREFGLPDEDVTRLAVHYEEEYLLAQADYTDKRIKKKNSPPVASPKEYFEASVQNNYAQAPRRPVNVAQSRSSEDEHKARALAKPDAAQAVSSMLQQWKKSKLDAISAEFSAAVPEKRKAIFESLIEQFSSPIVTSYRKNGFSKMVEAAIVNALFKERHPKEPTAEELFLFAFENGVLKAG